MYGDIFKGPGGLFGRYIELRPLYCALLPLRVTMSATDRIASFKAALRGHTACLPADSTVEVKAPCTGNIRIPQMSMLEHVCEEERGNFINRASTNHCKANSWRPETNIVPGASGTWRQKPAKARFLSAI